MSKSSKKVAKTAAAPSGTSVVSGITGAEAKPEMVGNGKTGKPRRKHANTTTFNTYIYRVLKQVAPDTGITKKSMSIMDSFCHDIFERVCSEASRIARYNKKHTISAATMQSACRLVFTGSLGLHAASEANKAVTAFSASESSAK